jgi:LysR family pca operon transcriptional activator
VAPALLPSALARLRDGWPQVQIMVKSAANAALLDELRAGELDLVVGRMSDPRLMGGLSFELLHTEPLVFAVRAGHPLAMKAASVQAVLAYPLVVYGEGTIPRHNTESFCRRAAWCCRPTRCRRSTWRWRARWWRCPMRCGSRRWAPRAASWRTAGWCACASTRRAPRSRSACCSAAMPSPRRCAPAMAALLREAAKQQGALPPKRKPRAGLS